MKRALLVVPVIASVFLLWPQDRDGLREGVWEGTTTQGRWVRVVVAEGDGGPRIVKWGVAVMLACERTGRMVIGTVVAEAAIPIRERRFAESVAGLTLFHEWSGTFTADDTGHGTVSMVLAAITGTTLEHIGAETCIAPRLGFTLHPKDAAASPPSEGPDFELRIDAQGASHLTWLEP